MTAVKLKRASDEIVPISSRDDVEAVLREMWPDGRIPVEELHSQLKKVDISILKYHLGLTRTYYGIGELADLIWKCSNYERCAD
ncbi:TPA: hypothetical protein ACX6RM_001309 [Photobacterium damselae]